MKKLILWEVHIYPLGKKHYLLGGGILSSWPHSILGEKKHGYHLVSGTLSTGKWHIILWERILIPSGKSTRGNWNTTLESTRKCLLKNLQLFHNKMVETCPKKVKKKNSFFVHSAMANYPSFNEKKVSLITILKRIWKFFKGIREWNRHF